MRLLERVLAQITRRWRFPGAERFVQMIASPNRNKMCVDLPSLYGKNRIQIDSDSYLERFYFFFGGNEPEVAHLIPRWLPPDGVAIDVGANIGLFTLVMAHTVKSGKGRVIAAEPDIQVFERLQQHLMMNGVDSVLLIKAALGSEAGRLILHTYRTDTPNGGGATLAPVQAGDARTIAIEIPVHTLDDITREQRLKRLDLIKIDTEGWDFNVLRGGIEAIRRFQPAIIFEYTRGGWSAAHASPEEAKRWLVDLGYDLYLIRRRRFLPLSHWIPPRIIPLSGHFPTSCNLAALPASRVVELCTKLGIPPRTC